MQLPSLFQSPYGPLCFEGRGTGSMDVTLYLKLGYDFWMLASFCSFVSDDPGWRFNAVMAAGL